jgi:hypothetical protein
MKWMLFTYLSRLITAAHNKQHKQHQKHDNDHIMRIKEVYFKQENAWQEISKYRKCSSLLTYNNTHLRPL